MFNQHVLPYLSIGSRGSASKLSPIKMFNYILKIIHTGIQWDQLEIEEDESGEKEIHYTRIFRVFKRWSNDGSLMNVFEKSVSFLFENDKLDLSIVHGDGSVTPANLLLVLFCTLCMQYIDITSYFPLPLFAQKKNKIH